MHSKVIPLQRSLHKMVYQICIITQYVYAIYIFITYFAFYLFATYLFMNILDLSWILNDFDLVCHWLILLCTMKWHYRSFKIGLDIQTCLTAAILNRYP